MLELKDEQAQLAIKNLIEMFGHSSTTFEAELVYQMIETSLKLLIENYDTGQMKLINRSLKEMRHAYRIFNKFKHSRCISIFGSARTPEDHPDYLAAKDFSTKIAQEGWMCITGAANGIMKAGLEGSQRDSSFGLSIRLPFEVPTNTVIEGDPKLIVFRYFFTRKLMFLTHSDAIAVFPGGFGTMDELFEILTLVQTGKANIIPIVLVEGQDGVYWRDWKKYIDGHLLSNGWISPEDLHLFYIAKSVDEAVAHVQKFYHCYHSSRYVGPKLVIRLKKELTDEQISQLNHDYKGLVSEGKIEKTPPLAGESDHLDLPRIAFCHTNRDFGILRNMIDTINEWELLKGSQKPQVEIL
ncbi:MAG: Rossman fold protein, TIGR00730 family [Chlamydiales bacterium 38-26]|nr:MAG: Rossman fold protein, TIGR00730 family [Chlamydiales bacterium 38-26]